MNKYGGINKRKSPEIKQNLKVLLSLDYQEFQNYFSSRQKRDRTRLALPRFCHFSGPPCKVIRVDNAYNQIQVRPDYNNKDRPAYTKTDKQYRTRKTYYSTATRRLSTTLKDKDRTYDRLRNTKANNNREQDPLNRRGHIVAGSPGTHYTSRTFKFNGSRQNQRGALFYTMLHYE